MMSKGVRQITNIDNAYKAGIEGSVQWNITNYLRTEAGAAYTYAQNMSQDVPLSEIAPLETRLRLEGNFNNITLGAEMRYTGQQNRTNPLFGEFATKDFTLFNLDARIEVFKTSMLPYNSETYSTELIQNTSTKLCIVRGIHSDLCLREETSLLPVLIYSKLKRA